MTGLPYFLIFVAFSYNQWEEPGTALKLKTSEIRLREIPMKQKLSQLNLEVRSGINRTEISKMKKGLKNIEFFTVVKLAEALEVELIEFFRKAKGQSSNFAWTLRRTSWEVIQRRTRG
jgi:transcriptional regulator with XRE-family HTH domain